MGDFFKTVKFVHSSDDESEDFYYDERTEKYLGFKRKIEGQTEPFYCSVCMRQIDDKEVSEDKRYGNYHLVTVADDTGGQVKVRHYLFREALAPASSINACPVCGNPVTQDTESGFFGYCSLACKNEMYSAYEHLIGLDEAREARRKEMRERKRKNKQQRE